MKISVLIPVYKEPEYLGDIVGKILAMQYDDKEVVAVVDGAMTDEIAKALEELEGKVTVIFPNEHLGKAEALNRAAGKLETDVLLFLDNDILLPDDCTFLSKLSHEMLRADIVDMPKEVVVESLYSAMIGHEYQSLAIASTLFSFFARRSPGLIGSAFAVRKTLFDRMGGFRKVVHEDGDFGARAFRLHAKYVYSMPLKVRTSMPNNLRDWVKQRKRWTLINVLWFKENFLFLLKSVFKQPSLIPTLGAIVLPSFIAVLVFVVSKHFHFHFIGPLIFMLAQPWQIVAGVFLWLSHHALFSEGLLSTLIGFLGTMIFYVSFAVYGKFRFNPFTFIIYYFLYSPLLIAINVAMFIAEFNSAKISLDWKV